MMVTGDDIRVEIKNASPFERSLVQDSIPHAIRSLDLDRSGSRRQIKLTVFFTLLACVVWGISGIETTLAQEGEFCWKDSYGRGVGEVPGQCAPGQDRIGLLCYDKCPAGMARFGFDCHSVCPAGMEDQGLFCRRNEYGRGAGYPWHFGDPLNDSGMFARCESEQGRGNCEKWGAVVYPKCKEGYEPFGCCICRPKVPNCSALGLNDGVDLSCAKKVHIGSPKTGVCPAGQVKDGGLCYPKCEAGHDGVGPVCWAEKPKGWVDCGMGAAKDDVTCGQIIFDQVSSVGQIAIFVASLGTSSAGTAAAGGARSATRLAKLKKQYESMKRAWNNIKNTPEVKTAIDAAETADVIKQGYDISQEAQNAVTEEDMARVAAQIAAIVDPTGVASTVGSYTYPTCSKLFAGGTISAPSGGNAASSQTSSHSLSSTNVNGRNVLRADHVQGSFRQTSPGQWAEFNASGQIAFRFSEIMRDDWSVYLHDSSRNVQIQIDMHRKWISFGVNNQARSDLYQIASAWR